MSDFLSPEQLHRLDAYWRASNYLAVGQIYLKDNPLLKQPLTLAHIKPRLLGHWAELAMDACGGWLKSSTWHRKST